MARKRLNKKVLIVGLLFLAILAAGAIVVMLDKIGSAEKFEKFGQEAWAKKDYEKASRYYLKAISRSDTDSGKIELYFKLADLFIESNEWPRPVGCWNKIISIDNKNIMARKRLLDFFYQVVDTPTTANWNEIMSHSNSLLELNESEDIEIKDELEPILPYLYTARGRAKLATVNKVSDSQARLNEAVSDLEKAKELEPDNINIYQHLASATVSEGQLMALKGMANQKAKAYSRAQTVLKEAVSIAENDPNAHVNLIELKLIAAIDTQDMEKVKALESEYVELTKKFPSNARLFSSFASYYQYMPKEKDKAIENAEKAMKLDSDNVEYARQLSQLYFQKGSFSNQPDQIIKAVELIEQASAFPDASDESGPRQSLVRMNKFFLYNLQVVYNLDLALNYPGITTKDQVDEYISKAEQALHQIAQFLGSAENIAVVKYQGMLDLAKGNRAEAIKNMYTAYEQIESEGNVDTVLSYQLAKVFESSSEIGAAKGFYEKALVPSPQLGLLGGIARSKPEAILDYAGILVRLRGYSGALNMVDFYEKNYESNYKSRNIRFNSYIASGQFDEAQELLSQTDLDKKAAVKMGFLLTNAQIQKLEGDILRAKLQLDSGVATAEDRTSAMSAQLEQKKNEIIALAEQFVEIDPNGINEQVAAGLYRLYISMDKQRSASAFFNTILRDNPENITARICKRFLDEPDPENISDERKNEIEEEILSKLDDPVHRIMNMATFYQRVKDANSAILECKKVYGLKPTEKYPADKLKAVKSNISDVLFDMAIKRNDVDLMQELATLSRKNDFDGCHGNFYAGRQALVKEQYAEALSLLNECVEQRPVFSMAYYFRSIANQGLENLDAAIVDIEKAASLNPLSGGVAKQLAFLLYRRNLTAGAGATGTHKTQAREALMRAMALNPTEWQLQSIYAEYIAQDNPAQALAIRQRLQKVIPNIENAILLGKMATRMLTNESDSQKKESLAEIAASSYDKALSIDAQNKEAIDGYLELYRLTDQTEKAEELIAESGSKELQYQYLLRIGRVSQAMEILKELYEQNPNDQNVIKTFLQISVLTKNKQDVVKYSEELLKIDNSVENNLMQIQNYLNLSLLEESKNKLDSFREKHPDDSRGILLNAWLSMREGRLEKSRDILNDFIITDQTNVVAWQIRGRVNHLMGNYTQAIKDLQQSKSLAENPEVRLTLARIYIHAGRADEAITELKDAISQVQAHQGAKRLLETTYISLGRTEDAKDFYEEFLEKEPDDIALYNRAAVFYLGQEDYEQAIKLYSQAWQKSQESGGNGASLEGYLRALIGSRRYEEAFRHASEHIDGDFAAVAYTYMGEAKFKLGDETSAIRYIRSGLEKAQGDVTIIPSVVTKSISIIGRDEVERWCEEKIEASPRDFNMNAIMLNIALRAEKYNKALKYADKCLDIVATDRDFKTAYSMQKANILAAAYEKTSDKKYLQQAVRQYESLLAEQPKNIAVLNNLAYLLAENDMQLEDAMEYAKTVYEGDTGNPNVLDTYGYVLYKNGKYSESLRCLRMALQLFDDMVMPVPADLYEHIARVHEKLGNKVDAITAYEKAIEIGARTMSPVKIGRLKEAMGRLR